MTSHRTFAIRKLHSLAGVIPLGVFLFEHMFLNSFATRGADAYNRVIALMQGLPFLILIELVVIILPLVYHGIYGLWVTWTSKANVFQYTYYRNWMYIVQRLAGVITFIFVFYHFFELRGRSLLFGQEVSFQQMSAIVQNPVMFAFYALGLIAAMFHFANGLFTFCISWGLTVGPKSQRIVNMAVWVVFVVMTAFGINSLIAFR